MRPLLGILLALLYLIDAVCSRPPAPTTTPRQKLNEITNLIHNLNARPQVPCNDTRVAQVVFTDPKLSAQELLCQAREALSKATKCERDYSVLLINLKELHSGVSCSVPGESEIYLRNLLPELGNFTQGMFRRLAARAAEPLP